MPTLSSPTSSVIQACSAPLVNVYERPQTAQRMHAPGSQAIVVDGDRATADTFLVSYSVPEEGPILVRGAV